MQDTVKLRVVAGTNVVTIPVELLTRLGWEPGDRINLVAGNGILTARKEPVPVTRLRSGVVRRG